MRLQIKITELTDQEWVFLQKTLQTGYSFPADASRVCLVLEHNGEERHAEMPLSSFIGVVGVVGVNNVIRDVTAALTPDEFPDHLNRLRNNADPKRAAGPPRQDCAFCHRERNAADDNHADSCVYWTVGPGSMTGPRP